MLLNCTAYSKGHKLGDIPVQDISEHLTNPYTFVWVALADATPEEMATMQEEFSLHPLAVEDALQGHQRSKIEEYGDSIFAYVQLLTVQEEDLQIGELALFVGRQYVISIRNNNREPFGHVRSRCESEPELLSIGAGFVFYALLDAAVDRYFPVLDILETELEAIEEQIFSRNITSSSAIIVQLYHLKRKVAQLKHAASSMMEALGKVCGGRVPPLCQHTQNYLRDVLDHLTRINSAIDIMRETITTAFQVNLAMISIEETAVNKKLSAWAGIFAVATVFTGIWGMNFRHMPELEWGYGYFFALASIVGACGYLYWRFKRSGWL